VFDKTGCSYDEAVVAPFDYGLSYGTDFSQEITSYTEDDENVYLTVKVTNNGSRAGKEVVQVYYNPPYTDFDVAITITKEDLASYCYTHENPDGTVEHMS
jgi:beta-glucosidase